MESEGSSSDPVPGANELPITRGRVLLYRLALAILLVAIGWGLLSLAFRQSVSPPDLETMLTFCFGSVFVLAGRSIADAQASLLEHGWGEQYANRIRRRQEWSSLIIGPALWAWGILHVIGLF
jgi:hypothetical protein